MPTLTRRTSSGGARTVVRRIILFVILFALVVVAAIGLSGLLERHLGAGRLLAGDDAGPRALARVHPDRRAAGRGCCGGGSDAGSCTDAAERASLVWALYLTAMSLTSLIAATVSLASAAPRASTASGAPARSSAGRGVGGGVAVAPPHAAQRRDRPDAPARSAGRARRPLRAGRRGCPARSPRSPRSSPRRSTRRCWSRRRAGWCRCCRRSSGARIGALVWWWHWFRERASDAPGAFASVLLVIVVGACRRDHAVLARDGPVRAAAPAVRHRPGRRGARAARHRARRRAHRRLVWVYHARVLARPVGADAARRAARGLGDRADRRRERIRRRSSTRSSRRSATTLVDDDPRTLLLGGISALVVGAPAWWLAWRPATVERRRMPRTRPDGSTSWRSSARAPSSARHAADHRLPRVRVPPRRRRRGWPRGAHPRAARSPECDGRRLRLPLRGVAA